MGQSGSQGWAHLSHCPHVDNPSSALQIPFPFTSTPCPRDSFLAPWQPLTWLGRLSRVSPSWKTSLALPCATPATVQTVPPLWENLPGLTRAQPAHLVSGLDVQAWVRSRQGSTFTAPTARLQTSTFSRNLTPQLLPLPAKLEALAGASVPRSGGAAVPPCSSWVAPSWSAPPWCGPPAGPSWGWWARLTPGTSSLSSCLHP